MTREQMNAVVDAHYRAEEAGDIEAIVAGFVDDVEHDRDLLADLRIDRFECVRRRYGDDHVVDESIVHATARGRPFGLEGRGRQVTVRLLHVFDFGDGLIRRESAWLDFAGLQAQLSG